MRPIRSATITMLASALVAMPLTACQVGTEPRLTGEIVIAADLELSGSTAPVGKAYQRALGLKVKQINASGVLGGRKLRLVVKDNRSDPSESLRNIGEFADDPTVSAVIMGGCNDCAIGAARSVNDKRIPTIALASSGSVANPVTERRYMFKLAPNALDSAAVLAGELKRQKIKTVGILHTDDDYGQEGLRALTAELAKAKITLSQKQRIRNTDTVVSQAVSSLAAAEPDALIIWTPAEQAMSASASAQESKYKGRLYFDAAAAGELFFAGTAGSVATNTTMVFTQTMVIDDVIATTPAKAARKKWFRDYTAQFGGYYGFSSFAADAVQMITDAVVKETEPANRDRIRDVLETSQLDGLSGPIRMTPDNHSGLMPQALTMLVARDGRWRLAN